MTKKDFHDYRGRLERALGMINSTNDISKRNKSHISEFLSHCQVEGLSAGRIARYAWAMYKLAKWLEQDFDKADRKDIERLVAKFENPETAEWTKQMYKVTIKKFYKWMNGGEEYPPNVKWLRCTIKNIGRKLPEEILTEEEVKKMIESAEHPRDKAIISALYESGCRISELAGLLIKHVVFDESAGGAIYSLGLVR